MNELKKITKDANVIDLRHKHINDVITLSNELKLRRSVIKRYNSWYLIAGKLYYYKTLKNEIDLFNELLGVKIKRYFGLKSVDYKIARGYFTYGVVSENFREKDKEYFDCYDFNIDFHKTLEENHEILKSKCRSLENYLCLLDKLKILMVSDFYSMENDRHPYNFYFSKDIYNYLDLATCFDYDLLFMDDSLNYSFNPLMHFSITNKSDLDRLKSDDRTTELFYLAMDINILKFIKEICEENKILISNDTRFFYTSKDRKSKKKIKSYILSKK